MKDLLHFVHGNGFPAPCYRQMLLHLQERFECCYLDRVGHSKQFPVTDNWGYLVDEVIHNIQIYSQEPIIAVGHSLGGVLSFQAAIKAPHLFRALVLLDAPIMGRIKSEALRLFKMSGLINRITPAARTKLRKVHWTSREHALLYFKNKKLFKYFTPLCLEDYIDYGMEIDAQGCSLRFHRDIEYQIFRTMPHLLYQCEGKLKTPTILIYGSQSDVINRSEIRYMRNRHNILCYEIGGTHMFPMEHPKEAAHLMIKTLDELSANHRKDER